MKNLILIIVCLLSTNVMFSQELTLTEVTPKEVENTSDLKINWLSWEEAFKANETTPKKIYVDVYTDWCGYCKKMDKTTFQDSSLIEYLNDNFHAVKFNAERKEPIVFNGNTFEFKAEGRRPAHDLAKALLSGRLGYPSFVLLDEEFARIMTSPGYKGPEDVLKELTFVKNEMYKKVSWGTYKMQQDTTAVKN